MKSVEESKSNISLPSMNPSSFTRNQTAKDGFNEYLNITSINSANNYNNYHN